MCCVATSDPRCFLPVTMYGTTHAHLVHMCLHRWRVPQFALKYPCNLPPPSRRPSLGDRLPPPPGRPPRANPGVCKGGGRVQSKAARRHVPVFRRQPPNGGNHGLRVPSHGSCGDKRTPGHSSPARGSAAVIQSRNVPAAIGTAIASNGDKRYSNNMAVTKCADERSTRECSYSGVRHKVCNHNNTSESSWSRSPVTFKSPRPAMHRNVSKSGATGRWTCSPKWPHGYRS